MAPTTYALGPDSGRLLVRTSRTGLGRRAGHDLTIEVTRWTGEAVVDTADPARSSVMVRAEVGSLTVREGAGGIVPLTEGDRAEIEKNMWRTLRVPDHPDLLFRSIRVDGTPEAFTVEGDLTITGETHPVRLQGTFAGGRVRGGTTMVQSRWGITPYSAFFGALKLADEVRVEFDLTLPG